MELHAFTTQLAVPQAHDGLVGSARADGCFRAGIGKQQTVVAANTHRIGQALEQSLAVVNHFTGFAMHRFAGAAQGSAEIDSQCLVAKADAEHRFAADEARDAFHQPSGGCGCARPGRENDGIGVICGRKKTGFVVAQYRAFRTGCLEVVEQVISERIVIVEEQDLLHRVAMKGLR